MSTFGSLTLDGVVFGASDITAGVAKWVDRTSGVPGGFAPITLQVRTPNAQTKNYRVVSKFVRPTVQTESTSCACPGEVIRQMIADVTIVLPSSSTLAERQEFLDQLQAFMMSVPYTAAVENVEPVNG